MLASRSGGGVWSRKSVTNKKVGLLRYIPYTNHFLLVDKKNARNMMKKENPPN
jgi:hypothetical protein